MSTSPLYLILLPIAITLWLWIYKTLKKAIKIKAIKGLGDRIILAALFFFTTGIGSIIYLKIKIHQKLKSPKERQDKKIIPESKKIIKSFWNIVWKDDSPKGWIISLVFLFAVIKMAFLPLISLATGTSLPLVIVESCSMYHEGNLISDYDAWFERNNLKYFEHDISKTKFDDFPFKKGFNKGDVLFVTGVKPKKLEIGDVIIFNANYRNPVVHRITKIKKSNDEYIFSTLGDNNPSQIEFERRINENQIIGKAQLNIAPFFGWIKLIFFEHTRYPSQRGFCTGN